MIEVQGKCDVCGKVSKAKKRKGCGFTTTGAFLRIKYPRGWRMCKKGWLCQKCNESYEKSLKRKPIKKMKIGFEIASKHESDLKIDDQIEMVKKIEGIVRQHARCTNIKVKVLNNEVKR